MALTVNEETILKLKVELDKLNKEKDNLIASRAAKLDDIQNTYASAAAGIHATDDALINTKEIEISTKQTAINNELGK